MMKLLDDRRLRTVGTTGLVLLIIAAAWSVPVDVAMAVPGSCDGDYNEDGTCDAADYSAWRKLDGDAQGYDAWRENYGETGAGASPLANAVTTPEPSGAVLALVGGFFGYMFTQRRRRGSIR
jgi:hypothetical protein